MVLMGRKTQNHSLCREIDVLEPRLEIFLSEVSPLIEGVVSHRSLMGKLTPCCKEIYVKQLNLFLEMLF